MSFIHTNEGLKIFGKYIEPEKCSIKEVAEIRHTYRALEIVASAFGVDIDGDFEKLYKECMYLRALRGWSDFKPLTAEEIEYEEKREKECEELLKSDDEDSYFDFECSECPGSEEYYKKVYRFVEIMSTEFVNITVEMKKEAFKLFPEVVLDIGNVADDVTCDSEEVF